MLKSRLSRVKPGTLVGAEKLMHDSVLRSAELRRTAQEIASHYGGDPSVRAVLLCGSVSRGWADRWSDIEMTVCWEDLPSLDVRADLAASVGAKGRRVYPVDPELRTHEEEFTHAGEKIDLAHIEIGGIAAILREVTIDGDSSLRKHALVAGLRDAIAVASDDLVREWKAKAVVYPVHLKHTMIERNLVFGPHWWPEMLAERNDLLPLHDILVRIGRALLSIVAALNRTYLPSDGFKWSQRVASQMAIAPNQFARRLEWTLRKPPGEAVREAGYLITEIFQLIREHAPEVSIDQAIARFSSPRATWALTIGYCQTRLDSVG